MPYLLPPSLTDTIESPFVIWENLFDEEEYKLIDKITKDLPIQEATITNKLEEIKDARYSEVKWMNQNQDNHWLYSKLSTITNNINDNFYKFNLSGMYEAIQHTTYKPDMHYGWHVDSGVNNRSTIVPRKLSITIQLSDPESYEGGDLEIWTGGKPEIAVRAKGAVVAFPSFRLHRVTPVTKGVRHSLVVWVGGPSFK